MDANVTWNVSEDTASLLEAISKCKKELTKLCFAKFGSAKISEYKVFAPQKVCELLLLADGNTLIKGKEFDSYCHKALTDFEQFRLFKTKMFGDSILRIEAKFDVGEGICKHWYGDVTLA
jgi:hypothetical protein